MQNETTNPSTKRQHKPPLRGGLIHGHASKGTITPTYSSWKAMIQRCSNPNNTAWERYGARGIKVCERWMIYENFLADMGEKPAGLSLDRKDNSKGYFKENCKWATPKEQQSNRRGNVILTVRGVTGCFAS